MVKLKQLKAGESVKMTERRTGCRKRKWPRKRKKASRPIEIHDRRKKIKIVVGDREREMERETEMDRAP